MLAALASILALAFALPITQGASLPRVIVETSVGQFEVELDAAKAPISVANFLAYVDAHSYDDGSFHRTVRPDTESRTDNPIQVIQASRARGTAGRGAIPLERTSVTGLKHVAGTLSMARAAAPDSAVSDFFVCVADTPELDYGGHRNADGQGFAAFGRVVAGMDVIRKIHASPVDDTAQGRARETLTPPIKIIRMYRK